jgi:hypothetical protein
MGIRRSNLLLVLPGLLGLPLVPGVINLLQGWLLSSRIPMVGRVFLLCRRLLLVRDEAGSSRLLSS